MPRVKEFHQRFGHPAPPGPPLVPEQDLVRFRARLVREEYEELMAEFAKLANATDPDAVVEILRNVLKEAIDLCYVAEGAAVAFGLPFEAAFEEVHASNMSKTPNGQDKPTKGPSYFAADMARFVPDIITIKEDDIT